MKVMYLTAEGFDTPNPNNQLAMTMIDDFLNAGIEVYLVQSHKKGIYADIPDILRDRRGFTSDTIVRKVVDKTRFVKRYLDELKYAWRAKNVWKRHKDDIDVVCLQSNPTSVFYIWLLRHILKKPIVYSIFDIFPGSAYDIGVIRQKFIYNTLKLIQKPAYSWSDVIVVPDDDMRENLVGMGVDKGKIRIVANWYDDRSVAEVAPEDNRFFKENGIDYAGRFIVQFAGTLGYVLDFSMIVQVAQLLRDEQDIVFHVIGDGNRRGECVKAVEDAKLSNIVFYPWQRIEIIQDVYSGCSVCLIPLKDGVIGTGFPSKSALLMACRRVVISSVPEDSIYFRRIREHRFGFAVPSGNPSELAALILRLRDCPQEVAEVAQRAQAYSREHYSRANNTPKFIEIFNELYKKSGVKNV